MEVTAALLIIRAVVDIMLLAALEVALAMESIKHRSEKIRYSLVMPLTTILALAVLAVVHGMSLMGIMLQEHTNGLE